MYQHQKETKQLREKMRKEKKCANELMKDMEFTNQMNQTEKAENPTLEEKGKKILSKASKYFGLSEESLIGRSQKREITEIRAIIFCQIYQTAKLTYSEIGRMFDRHHSTIMHGVKLAEDLYDTDFRFKHRYNGFVEYLKEETI
jgi:chromosomal replication initiation ATPase DnaA